MNLEHDLLLGGENDTPAKPRMREFVWMAMAFGLLLVQFDNEPAITASHAAQALERKTDLRPCDGLWIRQCAAGECWSPQLPPPVCSPSSDLTVPRALPSHILTSPL